MFPVTDSSQTVIECLIRQAGILNIDVQASTGVKSFAWTDSETGPRFSVQLDSDIAIAADKLLIATGGHPKTSGFGWISAHQHTIVEPLPSLFTSMFQMGTCSRLQVYLFRMLMLKSLEANMSGVDLFC